ncbi:MAG: tRNA (guanosine(37)-N1)-methyltransferase TrmD [Steroidobacteraceae bacterium]
MRFEVVTVFAQMIDEACAHGVLGRAISAGLVQVGTTDPRRFTSDVHQTVDDRPYGGGPGMVLKPKPCVEAIRMAARRAPPGSPRILLSPQGRPFDQAQARRLAGLPGLVLVCGRYEGLDERIVELAIDEELSIGDFVLSGGELAALAVIDAVSRLLPGVLGGADSVRDESFTENLLDWPHYTRPPAFEGLTVPAVLQGGDHAAIRRWRLKQSVARTWQRRPDMIIRQPLSREAQVLLNEFLAERAGG